MDGQLIVAKWSQLSVQIQGRVGPGLLDLQELPLTGSLLCTERRKSHSPLTPTQSAENTPDRILFWQLSLFKFVCKLHWKTAFSHVLPWHLWSGRDRGIRKDRISPVLTLFLPPTASLQYHLFRRKPQPFKAWYGTFFTGSNLLKSQGLFCVLFFLSSIIFFFFNSGQHCRFTYVRDGLC